MYECCEDDSKNKRLIVFADSSSIVFKDSKCRIQDHSGLTRIVNSPMGRFKGLILHANLVYDEQRKVILGISSSEFVLRNEKSRAELGESYKRGKETIEEKESYKWLKGFAKSKETLKQSSHLTLVADREADIIELFDRLPDAKTDLIIRSQHNRIILNEQGNKERLAEFVKSLPVKGYEKIEVASKRRKKRKAKMCIRYGKAKMCWTNPNDKKVSYKINEDGIPIYVVDISEASHKGYKNESKLHWRILTTIPIENVESAKDIIKTYQKRWKIEEFFKLLKTDCYDVENTELTRAKSIRKLILYVMKASVKIQQLKSARDGKAQISMESVFSTKEIEYLKLINPRLEGKTEKQKNPYSESNLAYGAWVIARLGGWKEYYTNKRPPGSKTFAWGLEKFENMCFAFSFQDVS